MELERKSVAGIRAESYRQLHGAFRRKAHCMLVMTLTSSLNLVLGAKGKVAGLYFAIINSALYAINCMGIPLYGEVMYNLIYSFR